MSTSGTAEASAPQADHAEQAPDPRRWASLAVIAIAQLMVVLDATIVNIALPQAQRDLGITDANRQWVVTAYTLAFGGLLLLGGRVADYWGRKRTFIVGILGFAAASGLGGAAQDGVTLFAARGLQGVFAAMLAPASLALLTVAFTDARERAKAFGVYGGIAGGGAALGLVLGGVLTEYANWRWCLLVNIPVALLTWPAAVRLVRESRASGDTRYDLPGAVLVTLGLGALVYGFTKASEDGWGATVTWAFIGGAVALLVAFVVVETRTDNPLVPLRLILDRNRGGVYLGSLLTGAGFIGATLFISYYFQIVLRFSPVKAGLATLPLTAGVLLSVSIATQLIHRLNAKVLMAGGCLVAAVGMVYLTQIGVSTSYATHVLPALFVLGLGLGLFFAPMGNVALVGVSGHDAGAASALLNATQQVGGSLGTALLNTIYTTAAADYVASRLARTAPQARPLLQVQGYVHGYAVGFLGGAVFLVVGAVAVVVMLKVRTDDLPAGAAAHVG